MSWLPQDDVVMGTLTVRENLHFSAALRLPSHMTRQQRKERVERVIDELKLQQCANSKVSTVNQAMVCMVCETKDCTAYNLCVV